MEGSLLLFLVKMKEKKITNNILNIVTMGTESQGKTALLIYEWQDFNKIGTISNVTGEVTHALKQPLFDYITVYHY